MLDLIASEGRQAMIVLNRWKAGTRLAQDVASAAGDKARVAMSRLGNRVVYAETLGLGLAATESARGVTRGEVAALADEVAAALP